ncbi:PadR family transcriptional regulator [Anaerolentibacter hominis]|uniref:PadR family transcriptional regulator n=1 Tax=Anaerolentibacter hominis TaxID=3079009 RepID=UPI0031B84804
MRDHVKGGALTEVTFFILLSLYTPRHGYAIMQFIEEQTEGRLILGAGTLYGALNTLLEKGWIQPCGPDQGRKKEYIITGEGRAAAEQEFARLSRLTATAREIMHPDTSGQGRKEHA